MKGLKIGLAGIALGITALAGSAASAQEPMIVEGITGEFPTAVVGYSDLNLARPAGVDRLNARIRRAAELLCVDNGVRPLSEVMLSRACTRDAIAGAQPQVDRAVADFHSSQLASNRTVRVARR